MPDLEIFEPPELGNMSPEERADWRTRHYGNEGFDERQRQDATKIVGVASGDSWFDYLPARLTCPGDIIDQLNAGSRFNIRKTSSAGDTVENMVWGTTYWSGSFGPEDTRQIPKAAALVRQLNPKFFLFSGGGDDIAGGPLADFLNHVASGMPPVRESALGFLIGDYLQAGYRQMIAAVRAADPKIPIFFHGYDYPIADGRGVINTPWGWHFIGPWLRPAFAMKRFDENTISATLHNDMIDGFNSMLKSLHNPAEMIYHLDLRNLLATIYEGDYRNAWANELHPTDKGFRLIAEKFASAIIAALDTGEGEP